MRNIASSFFTRLHSMKSVCCCVLSVLAASACTSVPPQIINESQSCINLGNALEAPNEGDWGYRIEADHIEKIVDAGYDMVRIPVRWSAHTDKAPLYDIDAAFLARVDEVVEKALNSNLITIIDVHHYQELYENPALERERFLSIWRQLSLHYSQSPGHLYFEIINEPRDALTGKVLDDLLSDALEIIRTDNPTRKVIIGGAPWNQLYALEELPWPYGDDNLIATFHYYAPHNFTHQGAPWETPIQEIGVAWGSNKDRRMLKRDFDRLIGLKKKLGVPIFLGEFGAYKPTTNPEDRRNYYEAVRLEAERVGIDWCAWDFASNFAAYNLSEGEWDEEIHRALGFTNSSIPNKQTKP